MDLIKASNLAVKLMAQHGLSTWRFAFNKRKNAFGLCSYRKRTIFLSSILTVQCSEEEVKDTILHEIAHALVGSRHGHNHVWRAKAQEIGCTGSRTSSYNIDRSAIRYKYSATCSGCGQVHYANRRKKYRTSCKCTRTGRFDPSVELFYTQHY